MTRLFGVLATELQNRLRSLSRGGISMGGRRGVITVLRRARGVDEHAS